MAIITINQEKVLAKTKETSLAKIQELLSETDYKALKHADGALTDAEYAPIKAKRNAWRTAYNTIQTVKTQKEIDAVVIEE